ncbi:MAG: hypothetical protein QOK02_6817, partial [Mycobacterium sp.]|nr:hypothetical protein [Mycobacterium sp.]
GQLIVGSAQRGERRPDRFDLHISNICAKYKKLATALMRELEGKVGT